MKVSISINDEEMLKGAKAEAQKNGITLSEYITTLIDSDLKQKLQFKIICYYDDGSQDEEDGFYTERDLEESVYAYDYILNQGEPLPVFEPRKVRLVAYEVWKYGKLVIREEK